MCDETTTPPSSQTQTISELKREIERLRAALLKIDKFIVAIAPKPTKEHIAICKEIQHALSEGKG